jgi:hypothetical protein
MQYQKSHISTNAYYITLICFQIYIQK